MVIAAEVPSKARRPEISNSCPGEIKGTLPLLTSHTLCFSPPVLTSCSPYVLILNRRFDESMLASGSWETPILSRDRQWPSNHQRPASAAQY